MTMWRTFAALCAAASSRLLILDWVCFPLHIKGGLGVF